MNLVGYVRVSSKQQAKSGLGLAAQRRALRDYIRRTGHTLVRVEEDAAVSGGSRANRAGLDRAIEACKNGEADGIVIAKLDRLIRDSFDYFAMVKEGRDEGYVFIALDSSPDAEPDDPDAELHQGINALFATRERRLISIRTREALDELRAQGKRLGRPHSQPISIRKLARRMRAEGYTVDETYAAIRQKAPNPPSRATVARMMNDDAIPLPNIAAEAVANAGGHP